MLAGEWLERAHMRRGANVYEEDIGRVEGVPEEDQPFTEPAPVAIVVSEEPRKTVRPDVQRMVEALGAKHQSS